ncbi:MAG: hypothetical protein GPJ54_01875 [Candidatus Heimdallarchaeota archaeon]|nr:hypothetical protein [Candidatus Heimdallarchaeota archaeon]
MKKQLKIFNLMIVLLLFTFPLPSNAGIIQAVPNYSFENGDIGNASNWNGDDNRQNGVSKHGSHYIDAFDQGEIIWVTVSVDSDDVLYMEAWYKDGRIRIKVYYSTSGSDYKTCTDESSSYIQCKLDSGFDSNKWINKVEVYSLDDGVDVDLVRLYYDDGGGGGPG